MEFGLSLPGRGPLATPDSILKLATSADRLGYHALFVTDHVVLPASMARSVYPYSSTGHLPGGAAQDYLEPLAVLAWLAHLTRKIRIGTSVLVIPYRNPVVTAKTLAPSTGSRTAASSSGPASAGSARSSRRSRRLPSRRAAPSPTSTCA